MVSLGTSGCSKRMPMCLILSTQVTTYCALSKAITSGLLVKGAEYLETFSKIKIMAFDKTGTITRGEFVVTNFQTLSDNSRSQLEPQPLDDTTHSQCSKPSKNLSLKLLDQNCSIMSENPSLQFTSNYGPGFVESHNLYFGESFEILCPFDQKTRGCGLGKRTISGDRGREDKAHGHPLTTTLVPSETITLNAAGIIAKQIAITRMALDSQGREHGGLQEFHPKGGKTLSYSVPVTNFKSILLGTKCSKNDVSRFVMIIDMSIPVLVSERLLLRQKL
ncbi:hypothetical protein LguiB_005703 [Lonicera macranthoides]